MRNIFSIIFAHTTLARASMTIDPIETLKIDKLKKLTVMIVINTPNVAKLDMANSLNFGTLYARRKLILDDINCCLLFAGINFLIREKLSQGLFEKLLEKKKKFIFVIERIISLAPLIIVERFRHKKSEFF